MPKTFRVTVTLPDQAPVAVSVYTADDEKAAIEEAKRLLGDLITRDMCLSDIAFSAEQRTMRTWSISFSNGVFVPKLALKSRTFEIVTELNNAELADAICDDHASRSTLPRSRDAYRVEDFSDEIAIYVLSRPTAKTKRWRKLINLQFEGEGE